MPDIASMRRLIVILGLAGACSGIAGAEDVPLPRPRPRAPPAWSEPHSFREAAGPDFKSAEVTSAPSECRLRLDKLGLIEPLPRLIGPGACGGTDMVQISAVYVPGKPAVEIKPAPVLRCTMAEQLALWVRDDAAPKVAGAGPGLRSVETYDDYDCRGRNRVLGAKMSEHGKGNAVDIRAFHLIDTREIRFTDVNASKPLREAIRESACARFTTVLGPGSDGYHEEHIHIDLADRHNGYRICHWVVREPPKPPEPAKPAEPAADVANREPAESPTEAETDAAAPVVAPVQFADGLVPLPVPRPASADRLRHGKRKTGVTVHPPFILSR